MANVVFIFNGEKTLMQSRKEEKMKNICEKFVSKIGADMRNLHFIYGRNQLNLDMTFNEQANSMDKNLNEMNILVYEKIKTAKNEEFKKSKEIICPKCKENCRIDFNDYKIKLYECKNGHINNNISLDEYDNSQIINESKIKCSSCNINKSKKNNNNQFYKCMSCKQNLCSLCKSIHDINHKMIDYDKKNYVCDIHNNLFNAYCLKCKVNLCWLCEKEHNTHEILKYKDVIPNEDEIKEQVKEFRKKLDKLNECIDEISKILTKVSENLEIYYKINDDIIKNYEMQHRNFYLIQNIQEINNFINLSEIDEIVNDNSINNQFQSILDIYNKMKDKNSNNQNVKKDNAN